MFFLNGWRTGEVIALAEKRVQEHMQEVEGRFVYHERLLTSITVCFKSEAQLSRLHDAFAVTQGGGR